MSEHIEAIFAETTSLELEQIKEWAEVITSIESANKYELKTSEGVKVAFVAEVGGGLGRTFLRMWLKSRRPLNIQVINPQGNQVLHLERPFYFYFSKLSVRDAQGNLQGAVSKRFSVLRKKYDLKLADDSVFATVSAPRWTLWKFPVFDNAGTKIAEIRKKWGGAVKEVFTDADCFIIGFPQQFNSTQRAVLFSCAVSIDLDYFEENYGRA